MHLYLYMYLHWSMVGPTWIYPVSLWLRPKGCRFWFATWCIFWMHFLMQLIIWMHYMLTGAIWYSWYLSTIALFGCTTWGLELKNNKLSWIWETKNKGISPPRVFFLFVHEVNIQQAHLNLLELDFSFSKIEKCEKLTAIHIIGTVIQAKATPIKYIDLMFEHSLCSIDNSNVVHFRVYLLIFFR